MYKPLLIAFMAISIIACKQKTESKKENSNIENTRVYNGVRVTMLSKCGELFENSEYLPLPLNHGIAVNELSDTLDMLILGLPVKEPYVYVTPLAYFELIENQTVRKFILTYPEDEKYQSIKIESYNSFMRQNYPVKNIIDTWFANYKGLAKIRVTNWKDNFFAEELLIEGKYWKN